jgi:hypothetical protein
MKISTIYVNTYKFDFNFAKICIASIRFWYPNIEIKLIRDFGSGEFNTGPVEKKWNVSLLNLARKTLGWGYGKLEPLFLDCCDSFLMLDADTVIVGPVLESSANIDEKFIVDDESLPLSRFKQIYYDLDRISEIAPEFKYPGYGFNSGQWFGTSGILKRKDFERTLEWSVPPKPTHPDIVYNGDQAHLNFMLQYKEQFEGLKIARKKIMIWPEHGKGDFLDLAKIAVKSSEYPYVIHWAGMEPRALSDLPRADILGFFADMYYEKMGKLEQYSDSVRNYLFPIRKKWRHFINYRLKKYLFLLPNGVIQA